MSDDDLSARLEALEQLHKRDKALARDLGIPRTAAVMHAPIGRQGEFAVEMFGEMVTDGPPLDSPPAWPGWSAGPGPVPADRLDEMFAELPAGERARLIEGRPALNIRAWQIIVRRDGRAAFLEARRDRAGSWTVALRGLEQDWSPTHAKAALGGMTLLHDVLGRDTTAATRTRTEKAARRAAEAEALRARGMTIEQVADEMGRADPESGRPDESTIVRYRRRARG